MARKAEIEQWNLLRYFMLEIISSAIKSTNKNCDLSYLGQERLFAIWDEINDVFAKADSLNLDKKSIVINLFSLF